MGVWCESWLIYFFVLLSLKNLTAHVVRIVLGVICENDECVFVLVICGNHLLLVEIDEFSLGVSFYIGVIFLPFFISVGSMAVWFSLTCGGVEVAAATVLGWFLFCLLVGSVVCVVGVWVECLV